ncbi:MAG: DUF349 domain-containing protein [Betaproteobacteria bacterium]|nr:DUF349 domain-containing protein [Betaproteobacteria bacterium]
MLSWLLIKRRNAAALRAATSAPPPAPVPTAKAAKTAAAAPAPAPVVDEGPLLQAALGDDAALLRLAHTAQALATKLAAVEALADEAALRQAERHFRNHERKVHRLAKQRLDAAVTRRESNARAQVLLERARGLLGETALAVNHLVEIDRDWAALPEPALAPEAQQAWATLRAELDDHLRAQDEALRRQKRWTAEARQRLDAAPRERAAAAENGDPQEAARLAEVLAALRETRPDAPATVPLDTALAQAQQAALQLQAELEARVAAAEANAAAEPPAADVPAVPSPTAAAPSPQDEKRRAAQRQRLESLVQQAEAALAEGKLTVLQQRLQAIDSNLSQAHATPPESLRSRLQALHAERGRLKAWQQWSGARARDALMTEAEALASLVREAAPQEAEMRSIGEASADSAATGIPAPAPEPAPESAAAPEAAAHEAVPEAATTAAPETAPETAHAAPQAGVAAQPPRRKARATKGERPPAPRKLNLKQHAEAIHSLRQRWKALDHQGDVASAEQWQRFDSALKLAHEPVAAHLATLKAARLENLAARVALLDALEAGPAPGHDTSTPAGNEGDESVTTAAAPPPDWRACIATLDRFLAAWRKLGPVEHTVPTAARDALLQRLDAALARIEGPLQQARTTAAAEREQLIAQAERLLPPAGGRPGPDAPRHVRELQAAWQDHARHLPLPRGLETALWARFKAATDAVFTQREAAFAARDAELAAHLAEANALVDRLAALGSTSAPADIQRTLADVDRAWRQGGEVPRAALASLQARHDAARSAAEALLSAGQQQRWLARCDALAARLALCEAREDGSADAPTLDARWAEDDELPAPWQQALAQRWAQPPAAGPLRAAEVDDLLLRLEAALGLPSSPAWQAARHQLKLRALKDTMEGRTVAQPTPALHAGWLQALLRQAGLDATQRARLQALVASLRNAQPAALGLPADKS